MYSESRKNAVLKYRKAHLDRVTIELPEGTKDRYKSHAERIGKPLRRLIMDLIEADIKRVDEETGQALPESRDSSESR